jgi:hypothetical protein
MSDTAHNPGNDPVSGSLSPETVSFSAPTITSADKLLFQERFSQIVYRTQEYGGVLPSVWEQSQAGRLEVGFGPSLPVVDHEIGAQPQSQINLLVEKMKNARITSAAVEAAHVYMYEDLDDPEVRDSVLVQANYATVLSRQLAELDIPVRQVLFVDDYNPDPSGEVVADKLDIDALVDLTASTGYTPEFVLREADMARLALKVLEVMRKEQNLVVVSKDDEHDPIAGTDQPERAGALYLSRRNIELYRPEDDMVTCAMIDAALTIAKIRYLGEGVVNILPRRNDDQHFSYRGQQRNMRAILGEHLNTRVMPIFNLFTGSKLSDEISAGAHHAFRKPR